MRLFCPSLTLYNSHPAKAGFGRRPASQSRLRGTMLRHFCPAASKAVCSLRRGNGQKPTRGGNTSCFHDAMILVKDYHDLRQKTTPTARKRWGCVLSSTFAACPALLLSSKGVAVRLRCCDFALSVIYSITEKLSY